MGRKALYGCVTLVAVSVALVYLFACVDLGHVQKTVRHAVSSIAHMKIVFDSDDPKMENKEINGPLQFIVHEKENNTEEVIGKSQTTTLSTTEMSTSIMDMFSALTTKQPATSTSTTKDVISSSQLTATHIPTSQIFNIDTRKSNVVTHKKKHLATKYLIQNIYEERVNLFPWSRPLTGPEGVCIHLKTIPSPEPIICTFHLYEDQVISKSLQANGTWESKIMWDFKLLMLQDKDLNLIDLGAYLGVYTLTAARLGRQVLAVEPCIRAVQNLHRSVVANEYESKIKVIVNAISKEKGLYRMKYKPGYIFNATVEKAAASDVYLEDIKDMKTVASVTMDGLIPYVDFKKAILKIDISGSEKDVIMKSDHFFREIDIPYIFMHWENIHLMLNAGEMVAYLVQLGYLPKNHISGNTLDLHDFEYWNTTVIWIKKSLVDKSLF